MKTTVKRGLAHLLRGECRAQEAKSAIFQAIEAKNVASLREVLTKRVPTILSRQSSTEGCQISRLHFSRCGVRHPALLVVHCRALLDFTD